MLAATTEDLTDGLFLVYDLLHQTWATADFGVTPSSVLSVDGSHTWMEQDATTHDAATETWQVSGNDYAQVIETPWLKASGAAGEMRLRWWWALTKRLGESGIRVEIGFNYGDTYHFKEEFTAADLESFDGYPDRVILTMTPERSRCEAFRLRFTELPGANSEGHRLTAIRAKVAPRRAMGSIARHSLTGVGWTES
jgi:hypothetical protein